MTKVVMIGIARMGSTRLPGKVMRHLAGTPVIGHIVATGRKAPGVDEVWIATSTLPQDDIIAKWCADNGVSCFRGSETDVLSRFAGAVKASGANIAVRVTCDCPFLDPQVIGEAVALSAATRAAYVSNIDPPEWPDGLDCEVIDTQAIEYAVANATRPSDRDTVTQFIARNRVLFPFAFLPCPIPGLHKERWVLDTQDDWTFCERLVNDGILPGSSYLQILKHLNKNPELRKLNYTSERNERFFEALAGEGSAPKSFEMSRLSHGNAVSRVPLGAQTFSKSYLQYPQEAPLLVTHGNGGYTYDVDGNEYVDCVGGLLPVILGHRDPDVDFALRQQLAQGISLSLPTPLENALASMLGRLIPCAEMARFGKNGTDVTTAAVRLARHVTKRPNILSAGYHGWADWSVCHDEMRNKGIVAAAKQHTTIYKYGDTKMARALLADESYACVIVEPETDREHLDQLRSICDQTNTLLIFDEIITGFRFDLGGAQKLHGVTPDLATFGKAMANGMPLSALVGKRKYMEKMVDLSFSGTFFGETLSLAASIATIDKLVETKALGKIHANNRTIINVFNNLAARHRIDRFLSVSGEQLPRINFAGRVDGKFTAEQIKTLFMQEMIRHGVLIIASFNLSFAHEGHHLARITNALDATFLAISGAITKGNVREAIIGQAVSKSADVRG